MIIVDKKIDFLFIKFPIFLPVIYFFILYFFPSYENYLIILTILLLAEPHFAATWPFFLNDRNKSYIIENRIPLLVLPILIIFSSIILFFSFKNFFFLIFFAANVFHVTRQSTGISKLFTNEESEKKFQVYLIYFYNLIFFFIAILKFYFNLIPKEVLTELNFIIMLSLICIIFFYIYKFKNIKNVFTLLTGIIIFYPACFVANPVHVILMGVTMHYSQYLILTYVIEKRRLEDKKKSNTFYNSNLFNNFIIIIIIYSLLMTLFSYFGRSYENLFQHLIIIPIIGQMLHFYIDSHLWKFSSKHHRENTLRFIKI